MNSISHAKRLAAIALCWFALHVQGAWAFCVSNDTEFAAAAALAELVPTSIELEQGTYHIDGTAFDGGSHAIRSFQGLSLLGGYTANCASRQIDPANTIVTRSGSSATFSADPVGDLTIEGIAFRGAGSGVYVLWGANPSDNIPDSVNTVIRRNIFAGGGNAADQGLILIWLPPQESQTLSARLVENLVHGNGDGSSSVCDAFSIHGAISLRTYTGASASFTLNNNTVVNNNAGCGVDVTPTANLVAYNNIFYGNTGPDLFTDTQVTALLVDNVIGSHIYGFPVVQIGTLTGDPKLNGTFHPIESPPSPVINSGDNDAPGGLPANDLDGSPRVVGSTVDRGVYESNVDDAFILSVTNTNDSGAGSLREAITSANSNGGFNIIEFAIGSGCGPHVITLNSALPTIKASVLINGYTQTGSAENDLDVGFDAVFCIVLDGGTHSVNNGFTVPASAANGVALTVEGIAFSGFTNAAINLQGGGGHVIEGVRIGGSTSGGALDPVGFGVDVGSGVSGVTIGGSDNHSRNVIGDATHNGILVEGSGGGLGPAHDNQIINNLIGLGWNTNTGHFTNLGITLDALLIHGRNNTISGNQFGFGVTATGLFTTDAHDNTVSGNYFGVSSLGDDIGNTEGVHIGQDAHDNALNGNTIARNGFGIIIGSGQHNLISANIMHDNGCGIELGSDCVTPNDNDSTPPAGDPANRLQNFPVLTGAVGGHTKGVVSGTLTSTPGDYRIELFVSHACDASGYGEGETYLGHTTITLPNLTVNGQTTVSFSKSVQSFYLQIPGEVITATATAQAAGVANDTSEFSACFPYTDDTIFANGYEQTLF